MVNPLALCWSRYSTAIRERVISIVAAFRVAAHVTFQAVRPSQRNEGRNWANGSKEFPPHPLKDYKENAWSKVYSLMCLTKHLHPHAAPHAAPSSWWTTHHMTPPISPVSRVHMSHLEREAGRPPRRPPTAQGPHEGRCGGGLW